MNFYIMVFNNTHEAMSGEKLMEEKSIKAMVMPTPTYITKSCGISLRFSEDEIAKVEDLISKDEIRFKNIYHKTAEGFIEYK